MDTKNGIHTRSSGLRRVVLAALLFLALAAGLVAGTYWHGRIGGWLGLSREPGAREPTAEPRPGQLWTCGMHPQVIQDRPGKCPICHMELTPVATGEADPQAQESERKVEYWWDPMMNPPYISDRPGTSPMGMDLVPVYADQVAAGSAVRIDPAIVQNMGVRTAPVVEASLTRHIRAVGTLEEPEPGRHEVNLRVGGWIERLQADVEGMRVEEGDPLFELYSPELQVAVEELIAARKAGERLAAADDPRAREGAGTILDSAARRLELYGVDRARIEELAALDRAPRTILFTSPASGYLVEKHVFTGSAVMAGDTVLRIADTSRMWLDVQVFESDLPYVAVDMPAVASMDGRPGETLDARVIQVLPRIDPVTRTARVRLELSNPDLVLRQGMYATARLRVEVAERALVVPREAIIDTGTRQLAFVSRELGHFEPRRVVLGAEGDEGLVQVLSGLAPGEQVVTSGQFLLDAESRMREAIQKFLERQSAAAPEVRAGPTSPGGLSGVSEEWKADAEAALFAYLVLSERLGAVQQDEEPVDPGELVAAAQTLREEARDEAQTGIAVRLLQEARAMLGLSIGEQRERFEALSEAVIELAQRSPRTGDRVGELYVVRCPMAEARWLQRVEAIANPFFPGSMKSCGDVVSEIASVPRLPHAGHEHREEQR